MRPSPCRPPKPPKPEGVLLPRIVACEKRTLPRMCSSIRLHPIPECACGCMNLHQLCWDGSQIRWQERYDACQRRNLCLTIPVRARLCDNCGKTYSAHGELEANIALPPRFDCAPYHTLFIQPQVRLLCAHPTCERDVFDVEVCILLEVYLLHLQPCLSHPCRPSCPDLPLYPPPMC